MRPLAVSPLVGLVFGFALGFGGVQLERLGDTALTALVALPVALGAALLIRAAVRFQKRMNRIVRVLETRAAPVKLRAVEVEPPSDEPPRAA